MSASARGDVMAKDDIKKRQSTKQTTIQMTNKRRQENRCMSEQPPAARALFELAGRPNGILSFARPDRAALQALREAAQHLPIRSYRTDGSGVDPWEEVTLVGSLDEVMARLSAEIQRDYADAIENMSDTVVSELLIGEGWLLRKHAPMQTT